jgi:hypothetical protein
MAVRQTSTPDRVKQELYASALRIAEKCAVPEHINLIYQNLLTAYRKGAIRHG